MQKSPGANRKLAALARGYRERVAAFDARPIPQARQNQALPGQVAPQYGQAWMEFWFSHAQCGGAIEPSSRSQAAYGQFISEFFFRSVLLDFPGKSDIIPDGLVHRRDCASKRRNLSPGDRSATSCMRTPRLFRFYNPRLVEALDNFQVHVVYIENQHCRTSTCLEIFPTGCLLHHLIHKQAGSISSRRSRRSPSRSNGTMA